MKLAPSTPQQKKPKNFHEVNGFRAARCTGAVDTSVYPNGDPRAVWWSVTDRNGKQVGTLPGEWSERHMVQLRALAGLGPQFDPAREDVREIVRDSRLELLENSPNATVDVPGFTRGLAREEASQEGVFANALEQRGEEQWPTFVRELFGSLYGGADELAEPANGAQWIKSVLDHARNSDSWQRLQSLANGDPWASGVASAQMVASMKKVLDEELRKLPMVDPQRLEREAEELEEILGEDSERAKEARAEAERMLKCQQEVAEKLAASAALDQATDEAAEAATVAIEEISEQLGGLGVPGVGAGNSTLIHSSPQEVRAALANNPTLRKIAKIAGRMRIAARRVKREKTRYVPEQMVDVSIGGELSRLLPSELMLLADETGELLLAKKLAEREALQYELQGHENLEQGPVIVAVDASGSMSGARYEWAMGVTLAVLESAVRDKRRFCFFSFDYSPNPVVEVLKPAEMTLEKLETMLTASFTGGGTSIDRAITLAASLAGVDLANPAVRIKGSSVPDWHQADLVLVSDGEDNPFGERLKRLREGGVHTYGVSIGATFDPESAAKMSGLASVTDLSISDGSANVDVVFGL